MSSWICSFCHQICVSPQTKGIHNSGLWFRVYICEHCVRKYRKLIKEEPTKPENNGPKDAV